jgi:hypothetical protein
MNAIQSFYAQACETYDHWLTVSCADTQDEYADDACWKSGKVFYEAEKALIRWARKIPSAEVQERINAVIQHDRPATKELDSLCAYLLTL